MQIEGEKYLVKLPRDGDKYVTDVMPIPLRSKISEDDYNIFIRDSLNYLIEDVNEITKRDLYEELAMAVCPPLITFICGYNPAFAAVISISVAFFCLVKRGSDTQKIIRDRINEINKRNEKRGLRIVIDNNNLFDIYIELKI